MDRSDILVHTIVQGGCGPRVVIEPVTSAARQWCIHCLPDEAVSSPVGVYVLSDRTATACIAEARAEGFDVAGHPQSPQGSAA